MTRFDPQFDPSVLSADLLLSPVGFLQPESVLQLWRDGARPLPPEDDWAFLRVYTSVLELTKEKLEVLLNLWAFTVLSSKSARTGRARASSTR